jgi:uncharacterized protein DUF1552
LPAPFFTPPSRRLSRRAFLRGAGVAFSLPLLDAMTPVLGRAGSVSDRSNAPRRMVAIQTNMGILPQHFFPKEAGADYTLTPYLDILKDHRKRMTVLSGVSHPEVDGAHQAEMAFLSATPHPGSPGFKSTISLDQFVAERFGFVTRFPSLVLLISSESGQGMSYTRSGVRIPPERSVAALYKRMFVQGKPEEIDQRVADLQAGRSLLDFVNDSARRLQKEVGPADRNRLDQYFTSVRELEAQLAKGQEWERKPKPVVTAPQPADITDMKKLVERTNLMFDVIRLGLETDSTRVVSVFINTASIVPEIPGVKEETHSLTHHGNRPEALDQLFKIESAQFKCLAKFLDGLAAAKENNGALLDRTMVLYGTCMGSANSHANSNLPVLLAGGGFRHGQHLAFDTKKNYPLPNLFVSMLQRLGIETDKFASSTGTMRGLEPV